jgi:hypothetical protein
MGKIATLRSEIADLKLKLTAQEKLLASNPADILKYKTEFTKLSADLKKANLDYPALDTAAKSAAKAKSKDAAQKEQIRKRADDHIKELNARTIAAGKLLKITTEAGGELGSAIAELKKEIAAKEQLLNVEHAKNLKEYGDKKIALMRAYEGAADLYKKWSADATAKAGEADIAAQQAAKVGSAEAAKGPAAKAMQCARDIAEILEAAAKREEDLLKVFDPHRSGEKSEEYELSLEDAKPFSGVFSRADTYRKAYQGYVTRLTSLHEQAVISARQAEVATLDVEKRLAALSHIAQNIRETAEKAYGEMTGKLQLQGIVNRDLAGQMQKWAVKHATPEEDQKVLNLANTRWKQVLTNEAIMQSAMANLKRSVQAGIAGIPERERASPLIKAVLASAMDWVHKAEQYEAAWAEERVKGEVEYDKLVALLS